MQLRIEKSQLPAIVLLFAMLLGSVITYCHFFTQNINMQSNSDMAVAHFTSQNSTACCQMTTGHNNFSSAVADVIKKAPSTDNDFAYSVSFILLLASFTLIQDRIFLKYFYRLRRVLSNSYNYLLQALSQGILQPQIYNS